jgi:hypothetical protein
MAPGIEALNYSHGKNRSGVHECVFEFALESEPSAPRLPKQSEIVVALNGDFGRNQRPHLRRQRKGFMIRRWEGDFEMIWEIINDGAQAYKGIISADRWTEPYIFCEKLQREIDAG